MNLPPSRRTRPRRTHDDDGKAAPAGIYFIRLSANTGGKTASVAFVP